MPKSPNRRSLPALIALFALLALAPQAVAYDDSYDGGDDAPIACEPADGETASASRDVQCGAPEYGDEGELEEEFGDEESSESRDQESPEPRKEGKGPDRAKGDHKGGGFSRGFLNRVWKLLGEVDSYEDGVLSMTLAKIVNVPRKWRAQDDDLLDQDTTVLVGPRVRVIRDKKRVARDELDTANDVRVHGKLLRPAAWHEDEDGTPVPTVRAKKVYITG